MKINKILAALLVGAMTIGITACGSKSTDVETPAEGTGTVDKNQELIVYTNSASDGRDAWLIEKAKEAGFTIQVLGLGASEITNRLIAEKNNAIADVIFGLNNIEYEKLKQNELLKEWQPTWVDKVDKDLVDADGFYYPVSITPLLLITNNELANKPGDWIDLVKPEYKELYQIHALGGGTGKTIYASIISRYADPNGELGVSEEGWNVAKEYLQNAHVILEGEDSIGSIIDGSLPMDMHWASGVLTEQKTRDYKFHIVTPEVGVPYVVESLGIVKTTKNPEVAEEFVNWLGSAEIQLEWSNNFGTIPAHDEALTGVTDDIKELMSVLKPQILDWGFIADNIDAWVEKAELELVK